MRKLYVLAISLFLCMGANAQLVNTYAFTAGTNASLVDMTTGTTQLIAPGVDDGASSVTNIGFAFLFNGVNYTQFSVNSNGLMRLGPVVITNASANNDNVTGFLSNTNFPEVAPYFDDLFTGTNGKVHYKLTGAAPNQVLVVEWFVTVPKNLGGSADAKFQVWLEQTTNKVNFVYGSGLNGNPQNNGYTVGLAASPVNYQSVTTSSGTSSTSLHNGTQVNAMSSGTTYVFTPPALSVCTTPTAQSTGFTPGSIGSTTLSASFTAAADNPFGYLIVRSAGALNTVPLDGVTYIPGQVIGNGIVVQSSSDLTFTEIALNGNSPYIFTIFSYNAINCTGGPRYNTLLPLVGNLITCPAVPTIIAANNVTTTGFAVGFTSSKGGGALPVTYTVQIATDPGFSNIVATYTPADTTNSQTTMFVTVSGLTASTTYYVRVRAGNASCSSANSATASINTLCSGPINVPYVENFDGAVLPPCTLVQNKNADASIWSVVAAPPGYTSNVLQYSFNATNNADDYFFTRGLNLSAGVTYQLGYKYGNSSTSSVEKLKVYYGNAQDASAMNNVLADHPSINDNLPHSNSVTFTPSTTGIYYIGFQVYSNANQFFLYLDSISVIQAPACPAPSNVAVSAITANTASVSWTGTGSFILEYGPAGFIPGTGATAGTLGTVINPATSPRALTGLAGGTAYDVYVRQNCTSTSNGYSANSAKVSFTTTAAAPVCSAGILITECNTVTATITAGQGAWDFTGSYPANSIGFTTPGRELVYRFTPSVTAVYYLEITNAPGSGYIDYFYKPASAGCSNTGWIGIDDNSAVGKDAIGLLQAGVEYYILLDAESVTSAPTQTFRVCRAIGAAPSTLNTCINTISLPSAIPARSTKIEYLIDDAGNLVAALDFSTVTNAVGLVTASYYVNGNALRRDGANREYLDRNFTITTENVPASPVTTTLYFTNPELQRLIEAPDDGIADVGSLNDLRVTKTSQTCVQPSAVGSGGTLLTPINRGSFDPNTSFVTIQVPSFSTFYLHGGLTVLPAQLLTFSGVRQGSANHLRWTVAQEQDVQAYVVERSESGRDWHIAGIVNSVGNTASQRSYSFADNNISGSKQLYRLRQVDKNGAEKLSGIVVIGGVRTMVLTVSALFPNPAVTKLNLLIDAPQKDNLLIEVTDVTGRVVKMQRVQADAGINTVELNTASLAVGSYVLKVSGEQSGQTAVNKFVKQ